MDNQISDKGAIAVMVSGVLLFGPYVHLCAWTSQPTSAPPKAGAS